MPRIPAKEVEVTLTSGQVLHFIESEGDTIVVDRVVTRRTGTPINHPEKIEYYTLILVQHKVPVDEVQANGV